ncbi:MAG: Uma2 family endonuclease [Cetobacterium sp.]
MELVIINTKKELAVTSLFSDYQELREKSEENYEFINREIIKMHSPSKKHQDIVSNLHFELRQFLKGSKCTTMLSPFDIYLEKEGIEKEICVIPDISVMCEKSGFNEKRYCGVPTIIIEVLSSNWVDDMVRKYELYEEFGVTEYWIIDPNNEIFMIHHYDLDKKAFIRIHQEDNVLSSYLFKDLKINKKDIFEQI